LRTTVVDSLIGISRLPSANALVAHQKRRKGATGLHHYHAFGLRIASEIPLPELHPGDGPADVEIRLDHSQESPPYLPDAQVYVDGDRAMLLLRGMAFIVRGGRSIEIAAPDGTPEADIRIWLLGSVMAGLLHQRNYLPIHANVVTLPGGRAAAFAGDSGAGKSTLAAWLEMRRHVVLADDLCAIRIDERGTPQVFEGIPRVKLWGDTLEALGRSNAGLQAVASDVAKYHVPLGHAARAGSLDPCRLERIYLLDRSASGPAASITQVKGSEAARGVLANAYRWELGQMIQQPRAQFDQCIAVARSTSVFRVVRNWGMEKFDEAAEIIERHLMTPLDELQA
jgi:hypothetical protein